MQPENSTESGTRTILLILSYMSTSSSQTSLFVDLRCEHPLVPYCHQVVEHIGGTNVCRCIPVAYSIEVI